MTAPLRIGVLASGSGTNLQALLDTVHGREAEVVAVASDKPDAQALERAAGAGVPIRVFPRGDFADRAARDAAIADWLRERDVQLVVLAGYMQLCSAEFLAAFPGRVINVHPSLLPAFPGAHAVEEALAWGVKLTGCTVHFVDEQVDHGPIVAQEAVEVRPDDTRDTLHARIQEVEHRLLPSAVAAFCSERLRIEGRLVRSR
jgi:phosphoribosylglycinamide formyltransferase 1